MITTKDNNTCRTTNSRLSNQAESKLQAFSRKLLIDVIMRGRHPHTYKITTFPCETPLNHYPYAELEGNKCQNQDMN